MRTFFLGLIAALLILLIGFVAYGREKTWETFFGNADIGPIDFNNLARTGKPNDALICSEGFCPEGQNADATLPTYNLQPAQLIERLEENIRSMGQIYKRVDDRSDPNQIRFITWSNLMRFPDINIFTVVAIDGEKTALLGYAAAQLGYSDTGANLKRLKILTENLAR
ncbi:MAG: DUF1499 domain-containing protein [Ahrensia sp.]|nr:DUF1499 domain-containing protein [Ahrensia sp.]